MLRVQPTAELGTLELETLRNFERDGLRDTQFVKSDPTDRERATERGWDSKLLEFAIPDSSPKQNFEAVLDSTAGFTKCSEACAYFHKLAQRQGVVFHFGPEKGGFGSLIEENIPDSSAKRVIGLRTMDGVVHKADVVVIAGKFALYYSKVTMTNLSGSRIFLNAITARAVVPPRVFSWKRRHLQSQQGRCPALGQVLP